MSVNIEPAEQLEFHGPFTRVVKEVIRVKNSGSEPVIFKVKTTAPKQYCVRPNSGRIEPNSEIEVQIILQPFKEDLPEDFKCKDKFLVQTALVDPEYEQADLATLWSYIEVNKKESMQQHKLKCAFVNHKEDASELNETQPSIPEPVTTTDGIASSAAQSEPSQQPPAVPSHQKEELLNKTNAPAPIAAALAAGAATAASREISDHVPTPISSATPSVSNTATETSAPVPVSLSTAAITEPIAPATANAPSSLTTSSAAPASASRVDNSSKDKELKEALERIAYLEKQLNDIRKEEGLRARNQTGTSSRKLAPTVQPLDAVHQHLAALEEPRPTEGYPPQVVLGVAVLAFLFAYLFF
ncbi:PapD-like protein [Parasitella parasitica]|nr:PapD-like protein [Parasitella parasitica]